MAEMENELETRDQRIAVFEEALASREQDLTAVRETVDEVKKEALGSKEELTEAITTLRENCLEAEEEENKVDDKQS